MAEKIDEIGFEVEKTKVDSGLTQRQEMLETLRSGRTTMHKGRHITKISEVPSESELAKGNPALEAKAKEQLAKQKADIEAQLKKLSEDEVKTEEKASKEKSEKSSDKK